MSTIFDSIEGQALCTHPRAASQLAKIARQGGVLRVEVREDKCFSEGKWLDLGEIHINLPADEEKNPLADALMDGQFVWAVPNQLELEHTLDDVMPGLDGKREGSIKVLSQTIQDISRRLGFLIPCFALDCLREWPYGKPASWIPDTSAISQGAADFAAKLLFPMVRLRIPAVVNVEIQNMCDRFKSVWDSNPNTIAKKANCLKEHLKSQGAQRALLRLEWHSPIEVEHTPGNMDPLRFVFHNDGSAEVQGLNLTSVQRSLADRLIFETAKEHRGRLGPGQPNYIVTSDNGMARMALSEGMSPVFFHARRGSDPLGRHLSGTLHHPFKVGIYTISLVEFLWELASCFGSARFRQSDGQGEFGAIAMSSTLEWSPDHVKENLFQCYWKLDPQRASTEESISAPSLGEGMDGESTNKLEREEPEEIITIPPSSVPASPRSRKKTTTKKLVAGSKGSSLSTSTPAKETKISGYVINVERLFRLVDGLERQGELSEREIISLIQVNSHSSYREYRNFLASGDFVIGTPNGLQKRDSLGQLQSAIRSCDPLALREVLLRVPSFDSFLSYVDQNGRRRDWQNDYPIRVKSLHSCRQLGEMSASVLVIPDQGICATLRTLSETEFVDIAIKWYEELAKTEPWVLTGQWLEALAWEESIHPLVARQLLQNASEANLLNRYFEGSTPDTRFENHYFHVLEPEEGQPVVKKCYLYRGDFLSAERASVRLTLERK